MKIARTTTDGIWTLTQTISINKAAASAYVTMALKNNSTVTWLANLVRFADVDAGGVAHNNLDGTLDSAWGYDPTGSSPPFAGLLLQVNGPNMFNHQAWAINTPNGSNPCTPNANFAGTLTNVDGGIVSLNFFPSIAKGTTKTVKLKYTEF